MSVVNGFVNVVLVSSLCNTLDGSVRRAGLVGFARDQPAMADQGRFVGVGDVEPSVSGLVPSFTQVDCLPL
jgi:hypothetical protein